MRCSSVRQLYDEYTRGALSTALLTRIEEHLAGCAGCAKEFELNEQIAQLMREGSEVAHPGGDYFDALGCKVLERLGQAEEDPAAALTASAAAGRRRRWLDPLWWTGGAAAAALLALGLFGDADLEGGTAGSAIIASAVPASRIVNGPALRFDSDFPEFAPLRSPGSPTVVVSANSTKHELLLGPGFEKSPLSADSMAEVAALPPAASGKPADAAPASKRADKRTDGKIQTVALKPATGPADTLQKDLAEQFELIRQQMTAGDDKALDQGLNDLEKKIDAETAVNGDLEALPSVRQVRLFADARDALRASRPREAWTLYRRILMADETTPLAYRASLQLADLYYNEWADFKEAQKYYTQAQGPAADKAFTQTERDHIARQLDRLRTHAGNQWESLALLHTVQHGDWPEVLAALRKLTSLPGADDLLPETARSAVERVQAEPPGTPSGAPTETAIAIYKELEGRAATEPNANVRAWLEVALGDMQLAPFQEMQAAINHYKLAIEAGGDSGAARLAAAKRDQLINRQFLDLVR